MIAEQVRTVAAASEELSASIGEIGRKVNQSHQISAQAVGEAREAASTVGDLAITAEKNGGVIQFIDSIASQTNLLALNTTTEAARGAETGRASAGIGDVLMAAEETSGAATQVFASSGDLSQQAANLSLRVRHFISNVTAA